MTALMKTADHAAETPLIYRSDLPPQQLASLPGQLKRLLFGIAPHETTCEGRGFLGGSLQARARIEAVGTCFAHGYHAGLEETRLDKIQQRVEQLEAPWRGFAYEGTGMALYLLDRLTPWKRDRFERFLAGPGAPYRYLALVGAGWAMARLPRFFDLNQCLAGLEPELRYLAMDGYGFHMGYFQWDKYGVRQESDSRLTGYALRAFDQGLGRSLWFVRVLDIDAIAETIHTFAEHRHSALWAGVGLAAGYAGGVTPEALERLKNFAGVHRAALAQGVAFAAAAHSDAGLEPAHTQLASRIVAGLPMPELVKCFHQSRPQEHSARASLLYEVWRQRLQGALASS